MKVQILIDHWIAGDLVWIYCGPTLSLLWNHPDNNFLENLVQFEEDFNSGTKKSVGLGGVGLLYQTRPIPRSTDGDKKLYFSYGMASLITCMVFQSLAK